MKSLLYITYVDFCKNEFPGVEDKIASQIKVMEIGGYDVVRINQYMNSAQIVDMQSGRIIIIKGITRRYSIVKAVQKVLGEKAYIGAYIRFQFFSEDVREIVSLLHRNNIKVLMEFPTFPYEEELLQQGSRGTLKLLCDKLYRNICKTYIDAFVTFSDYINIYGVPCIKIMNGLDYSNHPLRQIRRASMDELHLVGVASMLPWHGYDRLLKGLANYYQQANGKIKSNIVFHLIGNGPEIENYKKIVSNNSIEDHVIFHGLQVGVTLQEIVSRCDIAVGSLGAFRIGITKLNTLKSREYCAWGFPSINSTETDILDFNDPFCLFIPENESPVDMEEVIKFYQSVYFKKDYTAEEIAISIRNKARSLSDVSTGFKPVLDYIEQSIRQ